MYGNMFNDAHVWKKSDKDYYLYKDDNKWVFFDELTDGSADFLTTEEGLQNSVIIDIFFNSNAVGMTAVRP